MSKNRVGPAPDPPKENVYHVRVSLLVSDDQTAQDQAIKYVENASKYTEFYAVVPSRCRIVMRNLCRRKKIKFNAMRDPRESVRMAEICVVFGDCPISEDDICVLEQQGIPVEKQEPTKKGRRHGK